MEIYVLVGPRGFEDRLYGRRIGSERLLEGILFFVIVVGEYSEGCGVY